MEDEMLITVLVTFEQSIGGNNMNPEKLPAILNLCLKLADYSLNYYDLPTLSGCMVQYAFSPRWYSFPVHLSAMCGRWYTLCGTYCAFYGSSELSAALRCRQVIDRQNICTCVRFPITFLHPSRPTQFTLGLLTAGKVMFCHVVTFAGITVKRKSL